MITVTKKQASLALVVVAFATIMIAGSVASSTGSAFANRDRHNSEHFNHFDHFNHFNHFDHFNHFNHFDHFSHNFIHSHHHGKTSHIDQSIGQGCGQDTSSFGAVPAH